MRHALIATNLTAKRVVDGVAKLLSKTDVNMLAPKRKEAEVRGADDQLGAAHQMLEALPIDDAVKVELLGIFRVRMGAYLCGKRKSIFDQHEYQNRDQIANLFVRSVFALLNEAGSAPGIFKRRRSRCNRPRIDGVVQQVEGIGVRKSMVNKKDVHGWISKVGRRGKRKKCKWQLKY